METIKKRQKPEDILIILIQRRLFMLASVEWFDNIWQDQETHQHPILFWHGSNAWIFFLPLIPFTECTGSPTPPFLCSTGPSVVYLLSNHSTPAVRQVDIEWRWNRWWWQVSNIKLSFTLFIMGSGEVSSFRLLCCSWCTLQPLLGVQVKFQTQTFIWLIRVLIGSSYLRYVADAIFTLILFFEPLSGIELKIWGLAACALIYRAVITTS